jgi:hypothetical protein
MSDITNNWVIFFILVNLILSISIIWFFFGLMRKLVKDSGFARIREIWPAQEPPAGKKYNHQYTALNGIWYKNAANLIIADDGLYLSFGFPVSLSMPDAVFIPWRSITFQEVSRSFWTDSCNYQIAMDPPVTLSFMKRVAVSFPEYLQPPYT